MYFKWGFCRGALLLLLLLQFASGAQASLQALPAAPAGRSRTNASEAVECQKGYITSMHVTSHYGAPGPYLQVICSGNGAGGVVRLRPGLPLVQVAEQHIASADGYVGVRWTGSQMGVSMLLLLHGGQQAAFVWPMQVQIQQGASVQCNSTLQRVAGITIISVSGAHPDKGGLATRVDVKCVMAHEGVPTADKSITDNSHAHQPVSELPPRLAEGEACYQLMHAACIQRLHDACT